VRAARSVILTDDIVGKSPDAGRWRTQWRGGVFVTAYQTAHNARSANVWCCMSNGNYDGSATVWSNLVESAAICRDKDSRRTEEAPQEFEVTVLKPRSDWRRVRPQDMMRSRHRTIGLQAVDRMTNQKLGFAIYLPSVWDEEEKWTADDLILSLTRKALGRADASDARNSKSLSLTIFEIDCYVVREAPQPATNSGFFAVEARRSTMQTKRSSAAIVKSLQWSDTGQQILFGALRFYVKFARRGRRPELAYSVTENTMTGDLRVSYDNQGSFVRSYADLEALSDLLHNTPALSAQHVDILNRLLPWEQQLVLVALTSWPKAPTENNERASRLEFLLRFDPRSPSCPELAKQLLETKAYIDATDESFTAPQALMALLKFASLSASQGSQVSWLGQILSEFENAYFARKQPRAVTAVARNGAFAANWILQASVAAGLDQTSSSCQVAIKRLLVPTCQEAVRVHRSITEEACAVHGLLALAQSQMTGSSRTQFFEALYLASMKQRVLKRWWRLQRSWKIGGFRYYETEPNYRTDVTSHVVQVVRLLLQM
jgi:hypothetical protein